MLNPRQAVEAIRRADEDHRPGSDLSRRLRRIWKLAVLLMRWHRYHRLVYRRSPVFADQASQVVAQAEGDEPEQRDFLIFDKKFYKANTQMRMPPEVRQILAKERRHRTDSELHCVALRLRAVALISQLPINIQLELARHGQFLSVGGGRGIIRQGHRADYFYYILYGSVIEAVQVAERAETKNELSRGDTFGEFSLTKRSERTSTVISKTEAEFLYLDREAFEQLFLVGGKRNLRDQENIDFLRNQEFLKNWPLKELNFQTNAEHLIFTYFRRDAVIVPDSNRSEWIVVVRSGSVRLLRKVPVAPGKLRQLRQTKSLQRRLVESRTAGSTQLTCRPQLPACTLQSRRACAPKLPEADESDDGKEKRQEFFVNVESLRKGQVFGLQHMLFVDQAGLAMVSNGAECLLIRRSFFLAKAPSSLVLSLRRRLPGFPSDEDVERRLSEEISWRNYACRQRAALVTGIAR